MYKRHDAPSETPLRFGCGSVVEATQSVCRLILSLYCIYTIYTIHSCRNVRTNRVYSLSLCTNRWNIQLLFFCCVSFFLASRHSDFFSSRIVVAVCWAVHRMRVFPSYCSVSATTTNAFSVRFGAHAADMKRLVRRTPRARRLSAHVHRRNGRRNSTWATKLSPNAWRSNEDESLMLRAFLNARARVYYSEEGHVTSVKRLVLMYIKYGV